MIIRHYYKTIEDITLKEWLIGGHWIEEDGTKNPPSGSFPSLLSRVRFNLLIFRNKMMWRYKWIK